MWILTFILCLVVPNGWASDHELCDNDKGPTGLIECLNFTGYQGEYQWATCLTSNHMLLKGGPDHICADRTRHYCWYKCMTEVHRQSFGNVSDDCYCDPNQLYPRPNTSLPQQCYSPNGNSCYWYRNCLEKKHFCKPRFNGYVIRYAERFCRVFEEQKPKLRPEVQNWMEAARKCQQVAMVPLLAPGYQTCNEIREKALASISQCYLNPDQGAKTICDISCWEHFKIFWAIKRSFLKLDTAWETLKGLWNIDTKCKPHGMRQYCFDRNLKRVIKLLKLNVDIFMRRKRRSPYSLSDADFLSRFADEVGTEIASALKWNTDVMDWLAFTTNRVSLRNMDIIIAIADIKALGIVTAPIESVNLKKTIEDFASALNESRLKPQVDGDNVWIKSLALCIDKPCYITVTLAKSDDPPWSGATEISHGNVGMFVFIAMLIVLIDKLLY